jgi:hypothetical protein
MKFRRAITLLELIVALGILSVLLTSVFIVYRNQMRTATTQQSISVLQTDIQQAFNIQKWDMLMSGYGVSANVAPIWSINKTNAPDSLILRSTGFLIGGTTRWSYVMDAMTGAELIVGRWNDEREDIHVGDVIVIMTDRKGQIAPPVSVTAREAMTYNNQDAYRLTLSGNVQTAQGNFVFVVPGGQFQTVVYWVRNDTLFRGNEPFLTGVEDFQVSHWVDLNGNGIEDVGERVMNPSGVSNFTGFLRSTRVSLVLIGPVDRDYTFPDNQITVEDHTYTITGSARNRRRRFYTIEVKARNIR